MVKAIRTTLRSSELVGGFGAVAATVLLYSVLVRLNLIGWLYAMSRDYATWPVDQLIVLFVCLSFAFLFLAIRRSFQLDREIARREEAEQRAHALARNDVLTGLPNRRAFAGTLEAAIARARRDARGCAVLLVNLDRFKPINDLHGHAIGDIVLREIGARYKALAPDAESLARIDADAFALVLEHEIGGDAPHRLAQRLIAAARETIKLGAVSLDLGATAGIAVCPADGITVESLLHAADVALRRAKRDGRGEARFFEASMDVELRTRAALEADLRRAISNGEIRPHYQPFFDLTNHQLLGFEVLARWEHPSQGQLPPDLFIPVAEDTGLIGELTAVLMREACREARIWPAELTLAVNISPIQLQDRWLPQRLLAILTETGFPAGRLEVEITENALVADLDTARGVLAALQNVGVRIALDDFGTGYSSLHHLRELKLDKIKIDRSFVLTMDQGGESEKIVSAILGLSRSLGLSTTAEGIEGATSLDQLKSMGCDIGQGFLFGAAVPGAEATQLATGAIDASALLPKPRLQEAG